jgi:hypothetical protein
MIFVVIFHKIATTPWGSWGFLGIPGIPWFGAIKIKQSTTNNNHKILFSLLNHKID